VASGSSAIQDYWIRETARVSIHDDGSTARDSVVPVYSSGNQMDDGATGMGT